MTGSATAATSSAPIPPPAPNITPSTAPLSTNLGSLSSYKITRLGESNVSWDVWQGRLRDMFAVHGLLDHVIEHVPQPTDPAALAVWKVNDSKARMLITMNITDTDMSCAGEGVGSAEVWDSLRETHAVKGKQTKLLFGTCETYARNVTRPDIISQTRSSRTSS